MLKLFNYLAKQSFTGNKDESLVNLELDNKRLNIVHKTKELVNHSSLIKNKKQEFKDQRKKVNPKINNPPPFKIQNKNVLDFSNPNALFEANKKSDVQKINGLFD